MKKTIFFFIFSTAVFLFSGYTFPKTDEIINLPTTKKLADLPNGVYMIELAASRLVLDVAGNYVNTNGSDVVLWRSKWCMGVNRDNQTWQFTKLANGYYKITMLRTVGGKSLDAFGPDVNNNGCKIELWDDNGTGSQVWELVDQGRDTYKIILHSNGKALDAKADDIRKQGCKIQLWDACDNCLSQVWKIYAPGCL